MSVPVKVAERLVAERAGIELGDGLRERLAAHLDEAARARGQTPARFAASLAGDPGAFQEVLDRVTVQETGFFRHPDQFAALAREILPGLEGPVVVWSAGCANGQEAYSLAMELAASGLPDWQVVATDISATAVARARTGRYSAAELAGLPPAHRRWLRPAGDLWEIDPALRCRVRVERAGLTAQFPVEPAAARSCSAATCSSTCPGPWPSRSWTAWPPGSPPAAWSSSATPKPSSPRPPACASSGSAPRTPSGSWPVRGPRGRSGGARRDRAEAGRAGGPGITGFGGAGTHRGRDGGGWGARDPERGSCRCCGGVPEGGVPGPGSAGGVVPAWGGPRGGRGSAGARRAYAAGLAALERCDRHATQARLDGWAADELAGVLRGELGRP
jgi:chemotaxis methyl-accepting protein methylase